MVIRTLLLFLFIVGCGREVNLKANKLESTQQITEADIKKYQKSGTLVTSNQTILHNGQTYKISIYSSNAASTFLKAQPAGSQIPVLFTGGFSGSDVVVETIQRQ